jgi:hypothetical protein
MEIKLKVLTNKELDEILKETLGIITKSRDELDRMIEEIHSLILTNNKRIKEDLKK